MAKIETRTILGDGEHNPIANNGFIIKDYQRGYRWEKRQVEMLLDDLHAFDDNNHKTKYCMQPLVVKRLDGAEEHTAQDLLKIIDATAYEAEALYELIDGQQRLTTALLILDVCTSNDSERDPLPYSVAYAHIRKIDEYYISEVKNAIKDWFAAFGAKARNMKNEIYGKLTEDVEFIWYEVDKEVNSVDVFNKLNIGKIPLTNAELFKAMLLNPDSAPTDPKKKQDYEIKLTQIAFEWDKIEQSLRDDDFWSFISNKQQDSETRIDYLLRLYTLQLEAQGLLSNTEKSDDPLRPFIAIGRYLDEHDKSVFDVWEDVVAIHDTLKYWFNGGENNRLYHYIGFLVYTAESAQKEIIALIQETATKTKWEVDKLVQNRVRERMEGVKLDDLSYDSHKSKIRKTLLLFNLETLVQNKADSRFSFKLFKDKDMKWQIEHIHARATDEEIRDITNPDKRKEFLEGLIGQMESIDDQQSAEEIRDFIVAESATATADRFLEFCCKITEKYGEFDENSIGNLTLLDSETNQSYHNALYPVKRLKIIERDKGDVFIPVCTKNVFLKMYSSKFSNMMEWTKDDVDGYLDEMKRVLKPFLQEV